MSVSARPVFVDTGFLVAAFNPRDNLHETAKHAEESVARRRRVTTDFVLLEFATAFAGCEPVLRELAASQVYSIRQDPNTTVEAASRRWFDKGMAIYAQHRDKDWGLVDCISFAVMEELGLTEALTHDRHFEQARFVALMRMQGG